MYNNVEVYFLARTDNMKEIFYKYKGYSNKFQMNYVALKNWKLAS